MMQLPRKVDINHIHTSRLSDIHDRIKKVKIPRVTKDWKAVKAYYRDVINNLRGIKGYTFDDIGLKNNIVLSKKTEMGMFVGLPEEEIKDILTKTKVRKFSFPIDLGSGIGELAMKGMLLNRRSFTGVEYDYELAFISEMVRYNLSKEIPMIKKVNLLYGNYFNLNFSYYDYFFFYCMDSISSIMPKFTREALPGSLLIAFDSMSDKLDLKENVLDVTERYKFNKIDIKVFEKQ